MRKSIGGKLLIALIIFTLLLGGCICLVVSRRFEQRTIEKYEYVGQSLTGTLAEVIDGERAVAYLETGEKDDYYREIEALVISLADQFEPEDIFIAVPEEDRIRYIWSDAGDEENVIGYVEKLSDRQEQRVAARMRGEEDNALIFFSDPVYGDLALATAPICDRAGKAVAMVFADFSTKEIKDTIFQLALHISLFLLLLLLVYAAIYYLYINRSLVRPIRRLTGAAESMTENLEGNETYRSDIHTGDELETLSKSFEKMDEDLRRYIADNLRISAERQRMSAELDLAASIQSGQLPMTFPAFPDRPEFDIHASMTPAKTVGGDFYDFFMVDDDHIALVMADVSGKGVPAALFMMIARILIKNRVQAGESPAQALVGANRELNENNEAGLFVTVWLAVVELSTGRGLAVNAGHEHPALRRSDGRYELVEYKHNAPVGILKRSKFAERAFELHPGDSLFVYTDGVTEATNREEALFGTDRMLDALNRDPNAACADALRHVMDGIDAFVDGAEQFDDITMMCCRYFGGAKAEEP